MTSIRTTATYRKTDRLDSLAIVADQVDGAPSVLDLKDISKRYGPRDGRHVQAISSVSLSVRAGEFVSILGPSGCGKSTLLMIIAGLMEPTGGSLKFAKGSVSGAPDFGIAFQDPVLFPWRDVQCNVELPAEVAGVDKRERGAKARDLLQLVGLAGFENNLPNELSGGMQQRVAIARALMLDPSLLLMDEPFGALDAMTREQMNLELQRISLELKASVIFVTHSIPEAVFLSDRILVMSGRPSIISETVHIDIPRPRSIELMTSDRFGSFVSRLRHALEDPGGQS